MRIALSTDGDHVSAHFGRCPVFTILDLTDGQVVKRHTVDNPGHAPGVIPQFLHQKGVNTIVCGGMGARALALFDEMGIQAITGVSGTIDETIAKLQEGSLEGGKSACTPGAGRGYGVAKTVCDHPHED